MTICSGRLGKSCPLVTSSTIPNHRSHLRAILATPLGDQRGPAVAQRRESSNKRGALGPASLALVEAFRYLPTEHLAELEQLLVAEPVSRGEVLMRQGDAADALYLVAFGRFAVTVDG